ncbi:ABC transporter ATP-binding protein [Eoetvoesiella caeni]
MKLLETRKLTAFYGDFQALFGIDFHVDEGEIVAVIGANGAGKSTLLKSITGLLVPPAQTLYLDGKPIAGLTPAKIVHRGVAMVPEGRRLFASLSVEENLLMGAYGGRRGIWNFESVAKLFPILKERRKSPATALSGGQQQMVAIGRALMSNPRLLICDELSLGLAPIVIKEIYDALKTVAATGLTAIIVEQDTSTAKEMSNRLYCLQEGRVSLTGISRQVGHEQITAAYFGLQANALLQQAQP